MQFFHCHSRQCTPFYSTDLQSESCGKQLLENSPPTMTKPADDLPLAIYQGTGGSDTTAATENVISGTPFPAVQPCNSQSIPLPECDLCGAQVPATGKRFKLCISCCACVLAPAVLEQDMHPPLKKSKSAALTKEPPPVFFPKVGNPKPAKGADCSGQLFETAPAEVRIWQSGVPARAADVSCTSLPDISCLPTIKCDICGEPLHDSPSNICKPSSAFVSISECLE